MPRSLLVGGAHNFSLFLINQFPLACYISNIWCNKQWIHCRYWIDTGSDTSEYMKAWYKCSISLRYLHQTKTGLLNINFNKKTKLSKEEKYTSIWSFETKQVSMRKSKLHKIKQHSKIYRKEPLYHACKYLLVSHFFLVSIQYLQCIHCLLHQV